MHFKKIIAIAFAIVCFNSCTSPKLAIAPAINPKNQKVIAVKPKSGKYTPKTPNSEIQKIAEDGFISVDEKWMEKNVGAIPDGSVCMVSLITELAFKKTDSQNADGIIIPAIVIKHIGVPQDKIDTAIPKLQSIVYRNLSQRYRITNL